LPILYPSALDALANPTASDTLAGVPHDAQHANANDAIEALQTKLGIGASTAATAGHALRVTGSGATAFGQVQHGDLGTIGANDHHAQSHALGGADHTASGLTAGHVLRATAATTFAFGAIADADIPATIARDSEVTTAVGDHAAAADPHTGYQKESEKGVASGYASLDSTTKVPLAQLPGEVLSEKIDTNEATVSGTFVDLATVGPSVTIVVPASGKVTLHMRAQISSGAGGGIASYAAAGANVIAAADANGAIGNATGTINAFWGTTIHLTGLAAGSTTFKMQYRADGAASSAFLRRQLIVDTRGL